MTLWFLGWRRALAVVILSALVIAQPAAAQGRVTLNLKNADISALIASVSEITGRNFIVDPRVNARVTVISSKPMDENEIYQVFLAILAVHGFAAIPDGDVTKIVPEVNAKQDDIPTIDVPSTQPDDQVVTAVIQVQNVSAAQIVPILRPLIPPQGHLAAYAPTNVLIISDRAGNVERVAKIIERVDLASNEEVEIVPLRHASASEVVRLLTTLEQGRSQAEPGATAPSRLVADERTNSILLGGDMETRVRLRTLISHLDTPLETGGNTQVIYLRYAQAEELVNVLQGVTQQLAQEGQAAQGGQPQGAAGNRQGLIDIQADEATNSLVVTAPPEAIRSLRQVIAQLDIRRAQVLVEAVIAEISSEQSAELGIQWAVDGGDDGAIGVINFNNASLSLGALASALQGSGTISPGAIPSGAAIAAGDLSGSVRFGALLSALAGDADSNILSTPTIVTLDNEEAEIVVGQNVPFVTGSFTTDTGSATNPFQTIQRQDVGLTLKVKPQINEGNAVKLEISQEVSNVVATSNQGPTTNKRSIKTTVLVEDGHILVLGGLIDDTLNESVQKVPGLGDVPVLGNLFRYRRTEKAKRNLMVFLHPVILRDNIQNTLYTNDKYSYIRTQQLLARQRGVALLPQANTPLLVPPEQVQERNTILNTLPQPPQPVAPPPPAPVIQARPDPAPVARQEDPFKRFGFGDR